MAMLVITRVYEILQYTGKTMCEISMVKPWIQIYPVLQDPKVGPHAWLKLHLVPENVFFCHFKQGKLRQTIGVDGFSPWISDHIPHQCLLQGFAPQL